MNSISWDSFSHGQVISKLWLCEEFERHIPVNSKVFIFGGWHNVLGFMMQTRRPDHYCAIINIDQDSGAITIANKICDAWIYNQSVANVVADCNTVEVEPGDVVINCSVEHMSNEWFTSLPKGTTVCIQSSDVTTMEEPWSIINPNPDMKTLVDRFPMAELIHLGTRRIQYSHFGYNRFMLIGRT